MNNSSAFLNHFCLTFWTSRERASDAWNVLENGAFREEDVETRHGLDGAGIRLIPFTHLRHNERHHHSRPLAKKSYLYSFRCRALLLLHHVYAHFLIVAFDTYHTYTAYLISSASYLPDHHPEPRSLGHHHPPNGRRKARLRT